MRDTQTTAKGKAKHSGTPPAMTLTVHFVDLARMEGPCKTCFPRLGDGSVGKVSASQTRGSELHHSQKPGVVLHICDPSVERTETEGSLGLTSHPAQLIS